MTSIQLYEATSHDWVVGMGYRINDLRLFGEGTSRKAKDKKDRGRQDGLSAVSSGQINHDLTLRLDLSHRRQASISRDIASITSAASSGNTALRLSFSAEYTLSRLLTMSFYYDRQTNRPLLASNSYPTTTRDFGLSLKFSLTR